MNIPQRVKANEQTASNGTSNRPSGEETASQHEWSILYQDLAFEIRTERTRHAMRLQHMNELHAAQELNLHAKHTAELRRQQESHLEQNRRERESARRQDKLETAKHNHKMAHLSRQIAAEQRLARERGLAKQALHDAAAAEGHV